MAYRYPFSSLFRLSRILRFYCLAPTTRYGSIAVKKSSTLAVFRLLFVSGGSAGLALSLFSRSQPAQEKKRHVNDVPNFDIIVRESDLLYDNYMIDNVYNILRRHGTGKCSELLWRLARVVCEKGKMSKDKAERKRLMYEALDIAQRALDNEGAEGCFGAHKWYAIILNYTSEYEGTKERIRKSLEVRRHLEKALDLNGSDATTWHILGVWHFSYADLSTASRLLARTFFETPPSSTFEVALSCFEKAEFISPNFYSTNTFYMAETMDRLGRKDAALELYKKAFKMPVLTIDDGDVHKKSFEKLRKLGVKNADLS